MGFFDKWVGSSKDNEMPIVEMLEAPEIEDEEGVTEAEPIDVEALYELADRYRFGKGIPEDHKKAFHYYKKSAEQGFAKAYFMLGNCYHFGVGTEPDFEMAAHWFKRGAQQGIREAQHNLADAYETGNGVKKDLTKALYWYKKAAAQGIMRSILKVALFHADGVGGDGFQVDHAEVIVNACEKVPKDETEEEFWQDLTKKVRHLKYHIQTPSESVFGINLAAINICLRNQQITINEAAGGDKDAGH